MIKYLLILGIILTAFKNHGKDPVDRINIKGPLIYNKTIFNLAWTDKPKETYYIQEYLPAGQTVETFNELLTIHLFITDMSVDNAVQLKTKELDDRKKTDGTCSYKVNQNPDGKEFMIDFLLGESKNDLMTIAEFNIYRYKQIDIGENKKAILVFAYSKRAYGNNITPFYKGLRKDRIDLLNAMISSKMPDIKISD